MKAALISIKELAELVGVSTDTVRRAARKGLDPFHPGRHGLSL